MQDDLIIQQIQGSSTEDTELLLLFHGVGSRPEDLRPLGEALAASRPMAWVICVRSADQSDFGQGWQWFSVQGVTEANRPARVAAAMPKFLQTVTAWQENSGVPAARTSLIGFSQGAIMALESTQQMAPTLAKQVIAIAGRFSQSPQAIIGNTIINLMHGEQDSVMPIALSVAANARLQDLGVRSSLDRFPQLGHGIDAHVVNAILTRLEESVEA